MDSRRKELGAFLKAIRERATPETFGLPIGPRRRTAGLRREEVAQLADISPTWYTWIEQGREVSMSADTLDRLAQALRLERTQRAYLFELAGRRDPKAQDPTTDALPDSLRRVLEAQSGPAYVLGRFWDMLGWNPPAERLFGDWLRAAAAPNLLAYVFLDPAARELIADWPARSKRLVAEFRADCSAYLDDPVLRQQLDMLQAQSPWFAECWGSRDVQERHGGWREFKTADDQLHRYLQVTLRPVEPEHLKLVLLLAETP